MNYSLLYIIFASNYIVPPIYTLVYEVYIFKDSSFEGSDMLDPSHNCHVCLSMMCTHQTQWFMVVDVKFHIYIYIDTMPQLG